MIRHCLDLNDQQHLAAVSQAIIDLSEGLPDVVDEIERAQQRQPAPRNARSLYMARHALEIIYLDLREARADLFAPPSPPPATPTDNQPAELSGTEPPGAEQAKAEPAEVEPTKAEA